MFERFNEKAIKAVMLAQEESPSVPKWYFDLDQKRIYIIWFRYTWVWWQESRRLGHNYVGTEMLLVGVVADTSGASGKVLKKFNVTLKDRRVDYTSDVKRDWKEHRKAMSLAGNPQDDGRDGWPWYWHGLSGDPFHPSCKACIGRWCGLVIGFKGSRIPCSITLVHETVLPA